MKSFKNLSVHSKIFLGWSVAITGGLYGFILSKRFITRQRYENMKSRERIRNALNGDFQADKQVKNLTW